MSLMLVIGFCLLGSACSVGLAALVLLLLEGKQLTFGIAALIPYAIGTLLGAAFFGMIPHALHIWTAPPSCRRYWPGSSVLRAGEVRPVAALP